MVHLENFWQTYQDEGLVVLALAQGQTGPVVASWAESKGITYHLGLDSDYEVFRRFQEGGFPFNALIGRDGRLVFSGPGLDVNAMDALIQSELDETPVEESSWSRVKALF